MSSLVDDWITTTLGDFASLQRGHDLPEPARNPGDVPVMGSFGITGSHSVSSARGPGVTVGRSGASIGVVAYIDCCKCLGGRLCDALYRGLAAWPMDRANLAHRQPTVRTARMSRPEARKPPPSTPAAQLEPNRTDAEARFRARAARGQGQSARGLDLLNKAQGDAVSD